MKATKVIALLPVLFVLLISGGCGDNKNKSNLGSLTLQMARQSLAEKYPKLPTDEILRLPEGNKLYKELQERYRQSLRALATEADRDGVKLVVMVMSPEVGKSLTLANRYGFPFITQACNLMGIDCMDITPAMLAQRPEAIAQMSSDGNWTKDGAVFVAEQLSYQLMAYDCLKLNKKSPTGPKPATFGDWPPKSAEVIEIDKNTKYHVTSNSQGLRMDHDVTFPKKKQTIMFMGNGQIYCPYLDDKMTPTALLQQKSPGKEFINAGYANYTIEDYLDLYMQKARYAEPDILVLCTSGEDVFSYFFTQRNRYSRIQKLYKPTPVEEEFYKQLN